MDILLETLGYLLPLLAAYVLTMVIDRYFNNQRLRGKIHLIFVKLLVNVLIWGTGLLAALSNVPSFSRTWETVIAGSGIAAAVLGLAAQSTLSNVFSGVAVSASKSRPFDIGDRIKVGDLEPGFVENITLRHVVLQTYFHTQIYIPNSYVGANMIINYTRQDCFSYPIEIQVAYETNLQKAMEIMKEVLLQHPLHYGEDNVTILCRECGEYGITLKGMVTTKKFEDNPGACSECLQELLGRFRKEGIEVPYRKLVVIDGK